MVVCGVGDGVGDGEGTAVGTRVGIDTMVGGGV